MYRIHGKMRIRNSGVLIWREEIRKNWAPERKHRCFTENDIQSVINRARFLFSPLLSYYVRMPM